MQFDCGIPNYKISCYQKKEKLNKLKTKKKKSFEGSLKYVILYTYIQKKFM